MTRRVEGAGREGKMGDEDLVDRDGNVYKKGLLGSYNRADGGLFGDAHASPKEGLFGPTEARGPLGLQRKAADGTPLYERSNVEEKAAGAVGLVAFAIILAAAAALFAIVTQWFIPTLVGSVRRDIAARRLSLPSVGYGLAAATVLVIVWAAASGTSAPLIVATPLLYFVVAWVPMRFGRALRNYEKGRGGWALTGWLAAALLIGWMVLAVAFTPYAYDRAVDAALGFVIVAGAVACFAGGLVWGLAGEPDLVRRGSNAKGSQTTGGRSPDGAPVLPSAGATAAGRDASLGSGADDDSDMVPGGWMEAGDGHPPRREAVAEIIHKRLSTLLHDRDAEVLEVWIRGRLAGVFGDIPDASHHFQQVRRADGSPDLDGIEYHVTGGPGEDHMRVMDHLEATKTPALVRRLPERDWEVWINGAPVQATDSLPTAKRILGQRLGHSATG
jgi:hypothetical protein